MGAKSEELARQFEAKSRAAVATLEKLSDADWKKVTEAEKWSVGVTAHHLASVLEAVSGMIRAVVAKQAPGDLSMELIDAMNAQHAKDFAACTRTETIELHRKGSATAAATIRGLSDADLATGGTVLKGLPPMTAQQLIAGGLLAHIDDHYGSIRKTVGH
jgi:DinB family protein